MNFKDPDCWIKFFPDKIYSNCLHNPEGIEYTKLLKIFINGNRKGRKDLRRGRKKFCFAFFASFLSVLGG